MIRAIMMRRFRLMLSLVVVASVGCPAMVSSARIVLPPGFTRLDAAIGLSLPTAIAFAPDGRMFVAQQNGIVRVFLNGVEQPQPPASPQPFIDLSAEVGSDGYRGLLGMALDPNFVSNRRVYLAYTVDPIAGPPEEPDTVPTFNRVVRYEGTAASNGNIADPATRTVLIGATIAEGIPVCWAHTIDCLRFGRDGMLLVSCGDGGHYEFADGGGNDPACFQPPYFAREQDLGAFRAQYLNSMNGKLLRIDPNTGLGLPSNPYWDGDGTHARSRIWAYGFRNPFRFAVRPGPPTSAEQGPGSVFIGDVGWDNWEEINVAAEGGRNFGWPCREGLGATPTYPTMTPPNGGCATINTPANPGALTDPLVTWHHNAPGMSVPPGFVGANAIGGAFYDRTAYPPAYQGGLFFGDFVHGWIKVLRVDAANNLINFFDFADAAGSPVDIAIHPITGELHYVSIFSNRVYRMAYSGPGPGDIDGNGSVGVNDLLAVVTTWGPCFGGPGVCPTDIDGSGVVEVNDLLLVITNWGS